MDTTKIKYDERLIIAKYLAGDNAKQIATELGTYNTTIRRILMRNDIPLRGVNTSSGKIFHNPFIPQDYASDYFLGYIVADGNVADKRNKIILSTNKDRCILEDYIKFIGSDLTIGNYFNKKYKVHEYNVSFSNKVTKDYLVSLGITPRKSLTMEYNGEFTMEFIRGVFDGDGCILKRKFEICTASKVFSEQLFEALKPYKPVHVHYKNMYFVRVHKDAMLKQLYVDLYQNGSYFLKRKKHKFGLVTQ